MPSRVHNIFTEEECPAPICPGQTHCVKLWCNILYTLVYYWIKWTPGKYTKNVSINKHQIKAAYFKLMCLWKCSQNQWRQCKIVLFCINALDLWRPWNKQWYMSTSKFFGVKLKYKILLFLQRNNDGSYTSYGQPFNWKLVFASLLTKARVTFLLLVYFAVHVCMLLWNRIDHISQHSASTYMHNNKL